MPDVAPPVPGVEARAGKFPGPSLIPALQAIQERVGWLPREELVALSREVRRPLYEIEGLISFYPHFRTTPPERMSSRLPRPVVLAARARASPRRAAGGRIESRVLCWGATGVRKEDAATLSLRASAAGPEGR